MKKILILIGFLFLTLQGGCQEDKTFKEQITVMKGIKFGDGSIQLTAPAAGQTVTWETLTGKPSTFAPAAHTHDYKDISGIPETDLLSAIASLQVLIIPKLTTEQITALTPTAGSLVYDISLNVLKIGNGTVWKLIITAN